MGVAVKVIAGVHFFLVIISQGEVALRNLWAVEHTSVQAWHFWFMYIKSRYSENYFLVFFF